MIGRITVESVTGRMVGSVVACVVGWMNENVVGSIVVSTVGSVGGRMVGSVEYTDLFIHEQVSILVLNMQGSREELSEEEKFSKASKEKCLFEEKI